MATSIKKIMGVERNSIRKLNKLQLSEELFCNPLLGDANLIYYSRLENNSNDEKNNNNGTDTDITYGTAYGKFGQGALFNGSSSQIRLPGTNLNLTGNFSISMWVKRSSTSANSSRYFLFSKLSSGGWETYFLCIRTTDSNDNGVVSGGAYNAGASTWEAISASKIITDTNWHHIVLVRNGVSGKIYVDNNEVASTSSAVDGETGSSYAYIGRSAITGAERRMYGSIDDVAVFSRGLSATEVASLFNSQIKKFIGISNV